MKPRMPLQPALNGRVLVSRIVVGDQMQLLSGGSAAVQNPQKAEPFLMTVPLRAHADHLAVERVQRGKQRRRTVALVVVRHRSGPAALQWQARLRSVERLNLTLLIAAQHNGMLGRVQVESNNRFEFLGELRIVADFEGLDQMGLQAILVPDAPDAGFANPHLFGHHPGGH